MFSITRKINIDAAHRVPLHGSKCKSLHGHTYIVEATFTSDELEREGAQEGMVLDFGFMKDVMLKAAHHPCDHATILYNEDPLLSYLLDTSDVAVNIKLLRRVYYAFQQTMLDALSIKDFMSVLRDPQVYKPDVLPQAIQAIGDCMHMRLQNEGFNLFFRPQHYKYRNGGADREPTVLELCRALARAVLLKPPAPNEMLKLSDYAHFNFVTRGSDRRVLQVQLKDTDVMRPDFDMELSGFSEYGQLGTQLYIVNFVPTAENLAKHWSERMELELRSDPRVPDHVKVKNVRVWETPNCFADYH